MALAYRFYPVNKGNLDTRQVLPIVYRAKVMKTFDRASRITVCHNTGMGVPSRVTA